jgi:hypothetical protein
MNTSVIAAPAQPKPSEALGSKIKLRTRASEPPPVVAAKTPAPSGPATVPGKVEPRVIDNFERAYDNISIYERKIESTGGRSLRAELTVDTEDRVFNAISATAFLIVRNAGVQGTQLDSVELFMKTTIGGSGGRFHMTRADAQALVDRTISQQEYFIKKVIY